MNSNQQRIGLGQLGALVLLISIAVGGITLWKALASPIEAEVARQDKVLGEQARELDAVRKDIADNLTSIDRRLNRIEGRLGIDSGGTETRR